jgi:DGQHR domain-containing protein
MDTNNENIPSFNVPIIRVHQNNIDMYVGVIPAKKLFDISKVDRIRLEILEIPKYAGYQRALVAKRVDDIRKYLKTPASTFPNAIIASLDSDAIENWEELKESDSVSVLKIFEKEEAVTIIDGQHRAAALDSAPADFQVIVTFLIDLDIIQSAEIFAKINSTQKAVNPSIAFQLFGYSTYRSPQKTAHDIAVTLNTTEGSPFYKKLRMLGTKDAWTIGTLSQSTFAKNLMKLYTRDYTQDEYLLLRGKVLDDYSGYPLRQLFIGEKDEEILQIVWKYFFNVASIWQSQWNDETGDSILLKTTGFNSFMEVLKKWLLSDRKEEIIRDNVVKEKFLNIKAKYESSESRFIRENYPAGHQGVVKLRNNLLSDLELL